MVPGFPGPALRAAVEKVTGAEGVITVSPIFSAPYSGCSSRRSRPLRAAS
ncbi:hypothetical protein OG856_34125 [Streptomyces sp. NBC_01594]